MCGRFSQGEPSRRIADYFGAYPDDDLADGLWNVPPTEMIRVVLEREGERRLVAAKWGFRPFWTDADGRPRRASPMRSVQSVRARRWPWPEYGARRAGERQPRRS